MDLEPDCGCHIKTRGEFPVIYGEIVYCPMHAAAGELVEALKGFLREGSRAYQDRMRSEAVAVLKKAGAM